METAEITMNNTLEVKGQISEGFAEILTEDALQFVSKLHKHFNPIRVKLLEILLIPSLSGMEIGKQLRFLQTSRIAG